MIYVVEVAVTGKAQAWFAFEEQDLARKVRASRERQGWTIFETGSPRQLLETHGRTPDSPGAAEQHDEVFRLAARHGWDAVLYRADYLLEQGVYQAEPVTEIEACFAAIKHDLKTCRMYLSDAEAAAELYRDPLYAGREGFFAHMALREQLIAMEVISDDL
jgi:hypothetical protein